MPRVSFTANIQRHVPCPDEDLAGKDVRGVLDAYFEKHPRARSYVVDDQGALRHHMVVFVDGEPMKDRRGLGDPVAGDSEILVFQALSGG